MTATGLHTIKNYFKLTLILKTTFAYSDACHIGKDYKLTLRLVRNTITKILPSFNRHTGENHTDKTDSLTAGFVFTVSIVFIKKIRGQEDKG